MFNRDTAGFRSGSSGKLLHLTNRHLLVEAEGRIRPIPLKHVDRISVCRTNPLTVSPGERLQLKANARDKDGRKLANGELVTVKEALADGGIALADGRTLPTSYRQFTHGYAVTSYAAQGKTVDQVLFSDSASRPATSAQQWYVTISRGRKGIAIFTSNPEQLRTKITRSGERPLAMELGPRVLKRSWLYKLLAKRLGERAANIFERALRHRVSERLRERRRQIVQQTERGRRVTRAQSKSHGVGFECHAIEMYPARHLDQEAAAWKTANTDCISLLYTLWGFRGKKWLNARNAELQNPLQTQAESTLSKRSKKPSLTYKTVALPLS